MTEPVLCTSTHWITFPRSCVKRCTSSTQSMRKSLAVELPLRMWLSTSDDFTMKRSAEVLFCIQKLKSFELINILRVFFFFFLKTLFCTVCSKHACWSHQMVFYIVYNCMWSVAYFQLNMFRSDSESELPPSGLAVTHDVIGSSVWLALHMYRRSKPVLLAAIWTLRWWPGGDDKLPCCMASASFY